MRERGRLAASPGEIPWVGWRDILLRVRHEARDDNVALVAAGIAFYALLSVAPALAVVLSVYGLMASPADVQQQIQSVSGYLPPDAAEVLRRQLHDVASTYTRNLSWGIAASAVLSLWSASKATKALFAGLNAVYDEVEKRPYYALASRSLLFTVSGIALLVTLLAMVAGIPIALEFLSLPRGNEIVIRVLSWLLVSVAVLTALAVLYRYGPSRTSPQWRWVTTGAVFALIVWGAASAGLSWYVAHFDSFQRTYGALGAVVVLLIWLFLSALAVLIGGELNAEMEHQTEIDTTIGEPKPMGERGAVMADNVGAVPTWRRRTLGSVVAGLEG